MQPQEQISTPTVQFAGLGAELLSLTQLIFFLALGYAVTKLATYLSRTPANAEAIAKKIEDDEEGKPLKVTQEVVCDEPQEIVTSPASSPATKAAAGNSNARERKRQKKATKEAIKEQPCEEIVSNVVDTCDAQPPAPAAEEAAVIAPAEEEVAVTLEEVKTSERVAKLLAKKSERKAKKALEKQMQEDKAIEEVVHKSNEEEAPEPGVQGEEKTVAAEAEIESEVEASACDAQTTSAISMVNVVSEPLEELVQLQPESPASDDEDAGVFENNDELEKDDVQSEVQSEVESIRVSVEGISTPEVCLSPRDMGTSPMMWCGVPQPEFGGCAPDCFQQLPQIEGWMPILVPAEHAPPGAFDGIWTNSLDERIVIQHSEIIFESGIRWAIRMIDPTSFSVEVEGEEFEAELENETRCLKWSDGDTWTCIGQTENQQQWAGVPVAAPDPDVLMAWEGQVAGEPYFPVEMPMPPQQPLNTQIPKEAENWEICWDWKKKGWCPRGVACDWYHRCAAPQEPMQCQPCGDGPFADEQGVNRW